MFTAPASSPYTLALTQCASYERAHVEEAVGRVLKQSTLLSGEHTAKETSTRAPFFTRGMHVLVKPNLLRAHELTCTHAEVVRAVCLHLQEEGIKVTVADSPGFGTAKAVATHIGLEQALQPLGLTVQEFRTAQKLSLQLPKSLQSKNSGLTTPLGSWSIAREALEADAILSVPRCKAHTQMRMTLAVKNMFGCICGVRKALAHTVQGRNLEKFCHSVLALYASLPPTAALVDAVIAMHKTGPTGGEPFALHTLGASTSAMALDTAIYSLLQQEPEHIPLWKYSQELGFEAAFAHNIHSSGDKMPQLYSSTTLANFLLPQELMDICFQPHRLLLSFAKRLWSRAL